MKYTGKFARFLIFSFEYFWFIDIDFHSHPVCHGNIRAEEVNIVESSWALMDTSAFR